MARTYYRPSRRKSRYFRKEDKRSLQKTAIFGILTLLVILGVFFLGLPLLVKGAIFLGNIKSSGEIIEKTSSLPPPPPVLVQDLTAITESRISVTGYAQEGNTVWLFLNDRKIKEVVVDRAGEFSFDNVVLSKGSNEIKALAQDEKGDQSKYSDIYEVIFDDEPPTLQILEPGDGSVFFGEENKVDIKGVTDDSSVRVTINDRLAIVDHDGDFSLNYQLSEGENTIKIVAVDEAGNQTETEIMLKYQP